MARRSASLRSEDGAITLLVAAMLVVLLVATAFVVDLGRQRHARQQLQDAVDSASLAATAYLPANDALDVTEIGAIVDKITVASATGVTPAAVTTTFLCVLRIPPNEFDGARPDLGADRFHACGPGSAGAWNGTAGWTRNASGTRMTHACNPSAGDWCNAVRVRTAQTIEYLFAPIIGVSSGSTGAVQSTACSGNCKSSGAPLDVALVLDRTGSMSPTDVQNTKDAAKELLKVYDPEQQRVALLALPYRAADRCAVAPAQNYPDPAYATWLVKGLSGDYSYDGTTLSGDLVTAIQCLARAQVDGSGGPGGTTVKIDGNLSPDQAHTNLGDPMAAAGALLADTGRVGVPHVIIFMTDGQANQPTSCAVDPSVPCAPWDPGPVYDRACGYAAEKATVARTQAEIYTVAYGVEDVRCRDRSGDYSITGAKGNVASGLLADMATPPSSDDSRATPGACGANENTDGDHYFCTIKDLQSDAANSLASIFRQIAQETVRNGRLIDAD